MKVEEKTNIDFIGIGAQKAGTSWLNSNLKSLPDFSLLPVKELHYFDRSPDYPSSCKLNRTYLLRRLFSLSWITMVIRKMQTVYSQEPQHIKWYLKWFFSNYTDNWYLSLFKQGSGIKGEISPSYSMLVLDDVKKMFEMAPEAKLVFLMRNPVDRVWSHFRFNTRKLSGFDFSQLQHAEIVSFIDSYGLQQRSDYLRTISVFSAVFPPENILLGFYDAIQDNPVKLLQDIVQFAGGNPMNVSKYCNVNRKVNVSREIQCPEKVYNYIKEKYYGLTFQLAEQYGGYCNKWLYEVYGETSSNKNKECSPSIILSEVLV